MMKSEHTPEPWEYILENDQESGFTIQANNGAAAIAYGAGWYVENPPGHANGERIVACVNACAGINPEAVPDLLAALEALAHRVEGYRQTGYLAQWDLALKNAVKALSKAKGVTNE